MKSAACALYCNSYFAEAAAVARSRAQAERVSVPVLLELLWDPAMSPGWWGLLGGEQALLGALSSLLWTQVGPFLLAHSFSSGGIPARGNFF